MLSDAYAPALLRPRLLQLAKNRDVSQHKMTAGLFSLGGSRHERVEVIVSGYERQPVGDYHDDNWLAVEVSLSVGGFRGRFPASFLTEELLTFRAQIAELYKTLKGEAEFVTIEGQLFLSLIGNGRGGVSLRGEAWDGAGIGNHLQFELELDQTQLAATLRELDDVIERFPIRAG